jgi:hypothetical protein
MVIRKISSHCKSHPQISINEYRRCVILMIPIWQPWSEKSGVTNRPLLRRTGNEVSVVIKNCVVVLQWASTNKFHQSTWHCSLYYHTSISVTVSSGKYFFDHFDAVRWFEFRSVHGYVFLYLPISWPRSPTNVWRIHDVRKVILNWNRSKSLIRGDSVRKNIRTPIQRHVRNWLEL